MLSDPDLISGDGIYSHHLTRYPTPGRYKFTISVDDNENAAFVALSPSKKNKRRGGTGSLSSLGSTTPVKHAQCCGSVVALNPDQTEKTGIFRRTAQGPVVHLPTVPDQNQDWLPPNRIGDLKIKPLPGTKNNLLATWTAPGGDFNSGSVASYRFVFSEEISTLLPAGGKPEILLGFDRLEKAGTQSSFDFKFPHFDKDFYVAAYAFDMAGNRGKISNLVHVRLEAPPSMMITKQQPNKASPIFSGDNAEGNWVLIGAIAGIIGVLLIMSIAIISVYVFKRNKSRSQASSSSEGACSGKAGSTSSMMNGGGSASDETDSSSFDSDIKNIMTINGGPLGPALNGGGPSSIHVAPTHLPTHLAHLQGPPGSVDSGMSSNGSGNTPTNANESANHTPVYWSASQLLSKLDHSGSNGSHHLHAGNFVPGPYVHSVAQAGPHSLQTMAPLASHHPGGPQSLHNVSFSESLRYSTSSGVQVPHPGPPDWAGSSSANYQDYNGHHQIPEEYTITVGNLTTDASAAAAAANGGNGTPSTNPKVPPPVMPKPRNITQV